MAEAQRRELEQAEALRLLEAQMDFDGSESESIAASEPAGEEAEKKRLRLEKIAQKRTARRTAFAEVKSKFMRSTAAQTKSVLAHASVTAA